MPTETLKLLLARADETFGKERTQQLRVDIEQASDDIDKVRAVALETDDEP